MKLFLIRHGQTDQNKQYVIQGWTDNPLNQNGIDQAHQVGQYLKRNHKTFDFAYTSPLIRASLTGEIILSYLKNPPNLMVDYHFIERDFGVFENLPVPPTIKKITTAGFTQKGYEEDNLLLKRIENGLIGLYRKHPHDSIVLFCHSHVIKSFLILADPLTYNYQTLLNNGSMHDLSYDGEKLIVNQFNLGFQEEKTQNNHPF